MELVLGLLVLLVLLIIIVAPLKWAAAAMGARRTGFWWCLLALIGSSILHTLGLAAPVFGSLVAFLLSALAFAAILGTGFLRGVGIALLYMIFFAILIFVLSLFGLRSLGLLSLAVSG